MKKQATKLFSCVLAMVSAICVAFTLMALNVRAEENNSAASYLGMTPVEQTLKFTNTNAEGNRSLYNYSMMYNHTEEDLKTFSDFLSANGEGVTGLHIRKMDFNGDGELTVSDFVDLYKEVELKGMGYVVDGRRYQYELIPPYEIGQTEIDILTGILARTLKPKGGQLIAYYDYNLNGEIDICDLVKAKRFRATNPCKFIKDANGNEIQPKVMVSLLEKADAEGIENFIIVPSTEAENGFELIAVDENGNPI